MCGSPEGRGDPGGVAGRLDAEHSPAVTVEEIERAVRDAGYEVGSVQEAEKPLFWRTPRALLTLASALLFALGFVLGVLGAPEIASIGAYAAAIVVGGLPIFRAALGAAGIGAWGEAASVVVLS
ncbi:MAG: hypothetical protein LC714_06630 [Actinobacteria bacterium]|nr:hypothetical protein [Actinomycetota bacterium]